MNPHIYIHIRADVFCFVQLVHASVIDMQSIIMEHPDNTMEKHGESQQKGHKLQSIHLDESYRPKETATYFVFGITPIICLHYLILLKSCVFCQINHIKKKLFNKLINKLGFIWLPTKTHFCC